MKTMLTAFCLQASIDVLIKFVLGKGTGKSAHGKKKRSGGGGVLKRPVICICNDVYVPALRSLRQVALTVQFPPTASSRLASLALCLLGMPLFSQYLFNVMFVAVLGELILILTLVTGSLVR
jgi:hypothetical protein